MGPSVLMHFGRNPTLLIRETELETKQVFKLSSETPASYTPCSTPCKCKTVQRLVVTLYRSPSTAETMNFDFKTEKQSRQ